MGTRDWPCTYCSPITPAPACGCDLLGGQPNTAAVFFACCCDVFTTGGNLHCSLQQVSCKKAPHPRPADGLCSKRPGDEAARSSSACADGRREQQTDGIGAKAVEEGGRSVFATHHLGGGGTGSKMQQQMHFEYLQTLQWGAQRLHTCRGGAGPALRSAGCAAHCGCCQLGNCRMLAMGTVLEPVTPWDGTAEGWGAPPP